MPAATDPGRKTCRERERTDVHPSLADGADACRRPLVLLLRVARPQPPCYRRRQGGRPHDYARPVRHGGLGGVDGHHRHEYVGDRYPPAGAERGVVGDCCRYSRLGWFLAPHALPGRPNPRQAPHVVARGRGGQVRLAQPLPHARLPGRPHEHPARGAAAPDQALLRFLDPARRCDHAGVQL